MPSSTRQAREATGEPVQITGEHLGLARAAVRRCGLLPELTDEDTHAAALEGLARAAARHDPAQGAFESYAMAMARGAVLDHLRRNDPATRAQRRAARAGADVDLPRVVHLSQLAVDDRPDPHPMADPADLVCRLELSAAVGAAVSRLPAPLREALRAQASGMTAVEHATRLGVDPSRVSRLRSRAAAMVRADLAAAGHLAAS